MGGKSKVFGAVLLLIAVVCFLANFNIWKPPFIFGILPALFWNPLSYFTPQIIGSIGSIPLIGSALSGLMNYIFAIVYSAVLLVIGAFAVFH
jgi:hypothetical protein